MTAGMDKADGQRPAGRRLRTALWILAAGLWLLPLVAMQFTDEVRWTAFDFAIWAAMLAAACGAYELMLRMSPDRHYRLGAAAAIVNAFLVFWINGAVGMVGDGDNAINLLFLAAIALGGLLALLAWFRPAGMARALSATAAVHGAVALYALVASPDRLGSVFALGFVLPYLASASLFRRADRSTRAA